MIKKKITIVGLGYTGLPLLMQFKKKKYAVSGYDFDEDKVKRLKVGIDLTKEVKTEDLKILKKINIVSDIKKIIKTDIFIIAVPTPVFKDNKPNLNYLKKATKTVSKVLKPKNIVIFESTVFPGCTEKICVPILEKHSKLKYNKEFFCGYSPERINPGDKKRGVANVVKVTSGSNVYSSKIIDNLYKSIVKAGTHLASSIKVAEAAKVIENIQRDINIAFVNELAMLFNKLQISTSEVLNAAKTKWNFQDFKPGLVGGHCISVDPYYLTYIAKKIKFNPKIILAGRNINNSMPRYIYSQIKKKLKKRSNRILILGFSFKENCPDFRNSKVVDIIKVLKKENKIDIYDPIINLSEVKKFFNFNFLKTINYKKKYDAIILAVAHEKFRKLKLNKKNYLLTKQGFIYDVKSLLKKNNNRVLAL